MQEKKIVVQNTVDNMKDKLKDMGEKYKEFVGKIEDRSLEVLDKWREKSNDFVRNFIEMYGAMVSTALSSFKQCFQCERLRYLFVFRK